MSDGYWRVARIQGVPTGLTLGDFTRAEESLEKADGLVERILASRPLDSRALERGALIAHDRMIVADSEHRERDALAHGRRAIERMEAVLAAGPPTEARRDSAYSIYSNVALAHVNLRRFDEGIKYASRLLDAAKSWALSPTQISAPLSVMASARRAQGDLDGALKAIREARALVDGSTYADETRRMISRYPILLREAFILGEDRGISLGRPDEAARTLREALDMLESVVRRDPNDFTSRTRVGTAGRELGDILRWQDPHQALAVYDLALTRLGEVRGHVKARRDRALVLASSSYALRRMKQTAKARARVEEALAILGETKDYPADRVPLDSEVRSVLQALADQDADEGRMRDAIGRYEDLLDKVFASSPNVSHALPDAYGVSLLYADLARLHRAVGAMDEAAALDRKTREIWEGWERLRPNNQFVRRQLEASAVPTSQVRGAGRR